MRDDPQPTMPLTLRSGDAVCEVWPAYGGSIGRWAIGGQEMLRRARTDATAGSHPVGMATFPLVPYSNRIGQGHFEWAGQPHQLSINFPPEPHAIHGIGWTAPWLADQLDGDTMTLRYAHAPDRGWPWPFEAAQCLTLSADTLTIAMTARNLSDQLVPLAFGHHPYFDSDGASLTFHAEQVWRDEADGMPHSTTTPSGSFDFGNRRQIAGCALDNCYAGWDGKAQIDWAGRPLMLCIEADMAAAVIYIPKDGDSFCFEPVPHINNALNLPGHVPAMPAIAPGACFSAQIKFIARAARPIHGEQR